MHNREESMGKTVEDKRGLISGRKGVQKNIGKRAEDEGWLVFGVREGGQQDDSYSM